MCFKLYLIEILHQTTTRRSLLKIAALLYLIEILHQTTTLTSEKQYQAWLYLIEILHQTTTENCNESNNFALYLIEILHQTTTEIAMKVITLRCILSKFYIKPQHYRCPRSTFWVVSYRNSTSNHNYVYAGYFVSGVVSYRNSTSNHNAGDGYPVASKLYLIEILHQTTTPFSSSSFFLCCILSKFYIKPQPCHRNAHLGQGCILSKFYIKPQQRVRHRIGHSCCILSKFYIKPQPTDL